MGDFPRHEELQGILGTGVVTEIDQPLIDYLRTRLGGDVTAQVDIQLASDLQVVGRPCIALRIEPPPAIATSGSASAA